MENKIFEIKSFARIKLLKGEKIFSKQINFFDKIFFEEKNTSNGGIEIRKKEGNFGNIKFPTNAENTCFIAAKEMQKAYAKKNIGRKPKSIIITIEKNIPLNSGLGGAYGNGLETLRFLNNFWEINFSDEEVLKISEELFGKKILTSKEIFSNKNLFILIPKYISIEKKFFEKILNNLENFSEAQKKIKEIFPDLEKFIKIFLDNGAGFSDISGKGSSVFGVFDKNISDKRIKDLKDVFFEFGELIIF